MTIKLRQSTASQEIPLGHFVDSTDGNTEETALTIANTDIKLWKMGAITLANKNSGGATHISNGIYYCVLDATDTDTLGALVVFVHVAGALAVRVECEVLAANVYDSLIAASDKLQIDMTQIDGNPTNNNTAELFLAYLSIAQTGANVPAVEISSTNGAGVQITAGNGEGVGIFGGGASDGLVIDPGLTGTASIAASSGITLNGVQLEAAVWASATRTLTSLDSMKIEKNAALNNFMFFMRLSSDHVSPATGLTITANRSIDGAAFSACANAVTEIGNGWYKLNLAATDLNGDVIALKFTATGADQRNLTIVTQV